MRARRIALAVTVLLAGSALGQPVPAPAQPAPQPVAPYRVGFTADRAGDTEVESVDSGGGDRRNLSNQPAVAQADPAFSPDGTRLAYTEHISGEVSRVMVADADGRDPRPLTTVPAGSQYEPAWSPDGSMIAFGVKVPAGEGYRLGVRVVRVADGRLLTEIPVPAHLAAYDGQPDWSPDGSSIAITRQVREQSTPAVGPFTPSGAAGRGGSFTTSATLRTPVAPSQPEIMLLLDTTGSMGGVLADVQAKLGTVIDRIKADQPEATFGLATFEDIGDGARHYVLHQVLTADGELVLKKVGALTTGGGGDTPEDWFNALRRLSNDPVFTREATNRIVVLVGDASSHEAPPPCAGFDACPPPCGTACDPRYPTRASVIADLTAKKIRVVAVPVTGSGDGLDRYQQATDITRATDGVLIPQGAPPEQITEAILAGITQLRVTVTPEASCETGLSMVFDPPSATVPGDTVVRFGERVDVARTAPLGAALECTVDFRLSGGAPGIAYRQHVSARVVAGDLPVVEIDGPAVQSPNGTGVPVTYTATARDAAGRSLAPRCTPPSGSTFPVGVTLVTCTATDPAGLVGTATAPVTVVVPAREDVEGIWLVGVNRTAADQVTVTEQIDLSVRIPAPCAGGDHENPAWSPDGTQLALRHTGDVLCVVDRGGLTARVLIADGREVEHPREPAWSPDGMLIAFGAGDYEVRPDLWAIPSTGGTPTRLVQGADQPTFQRLLDLAVSALATPNAIAFGGRTTVEITITNRGLAPAPRAALTVTLPEGLRGDPLTAPPNPLAPGESRVVRGELTGVRAGPWVVRAEVAGDANSSNNTAEVAITVGEELKPPVTPGSLSVAAAVAPQLAFVGGDDIVVLYRMRNGAGSPMTDVRLVTALPAALQPPAAVSAGCAASGLACTLGTLQPGQEAEVRITLRAKAGVNEAVLGTVSAVGTDNDARDNTASARIQVRQPVLVVDPRLGPVGAVTRTQGTDFPPGARVRLAWTVGISETPGVVVVRPDGTFDAQVLVFRHDRVGPRELTATPATGVRFGEVRSNPFTVVPRTVQPPGFVTRG